MPFAPKIRKEVLLALEQHVLPQLRNQDVAQVPAVFPFESNQVEYWPIASEYLPDNTPDPLQVAWHWESARLSAGRFPYIAFVYTGVADYRIGVTAEVATRLMKQNLPAPPGQIMIRLPAPSVIYFPPFTPGHNGSTPFHDPSRPGGGEARMLLLSIMNGDIRLHLCESEPERIRGSHSLQVRDPLLDQMAHLYWEELKAGGGRATAAAQAQLFVFMSRLQRRLQDRDVPLGNSAWAVTQSEQQEASGTANGDAHRICLFVMDYIETHLGSPLSRDSLAQGLGVSSDHLGRAFQSNLGITVMRYVTQRRVEAAKLMLENSPENVHEIAGLVGFANATGFCAAFKRLTGCSPKEYRRRHRAGTPQ